MVMFAQKEVAVFENKNFTGPYEEGKESYNIKDPETNEHWILINHKNKLFFYHLNSDFTLKKEFTLKKIGNDIQFLQGYHVTDQKIILFFSNLEFNKLATLKIDKSDYVVEKEIKKFSIPKEKVVQSIAQDNKFYIITVKKYSSEVNIHEFKADLNFTSHKVTFPEIGKKNVDTDKTIRVSRLLLGSRFKHIREALSTKKKETKLPIQKINKENPNSIAVVSDPSKLYSVKNGMIFTFDNDPDFTQIIKLNTLSYKLDTLKLAKPKLGQEARSHNSYIYDDKIMQVSVNLEHFLLDIKNLNSGKSIVKYGLNSNDSIYFKNSPIILDGGLHAFTVNKHKEFEKTSKFLRILSNSNVGVSLYQLAGGRFQMKVGSSKEKTHTDAVSIVSFGGPVGSVFGGALAVGFNASLNVYSSVKYSKSTYFNAYLNNELEHIKGDMPRDLFEEIKEFENKLEGVIRKEDNSFYFGDITYTALKNVFKENEKFYYCYLDSKNHNYHIVEFKE